MTDKAKPTATRPTRYEISRAVDWVMPGEHDAALAKFEATKTLAWLPVAVVEATSAPSALRVWADGQGDDFGGGLLRAVPVGNISRVDAKVETQRRLILA